ncbi:MAG: hypothetical protein CL891_05250 [Dehalococcoidia bacterium]|nr:hypothetical protein [Dehalococcoidia bacterium]|tara:strand:+ start:121 stop:369 length:249 start_codon:yes stop_codon:yes gene_type:complete
MAESIGSLLQLFFTFLQLAIFARVIVSWISPGNSSNPIITIIYQVTEPLLSPLRKVIPRVGMFDFTPMIAIIVLALIQGILS